MFLRMVTAFLRRLTTFHRTGLALLSKLAQVTHTPMSRAVSDQPTCSLRPRSRRGQHRLLQLGGWSDTVCSLSTVRPLPFTRPPASSQSSGMREQQRMATQTCICPHTHSQHRHTCVFRKRAVHTQVRTRQTRILAHLHTTVTMFPLMVITSGTRRTGTKCISRDFRTTHTHQHTTCTSYQPFRAWIFSSEHFVSLMQLRKVQ